MPTTQSHLAIKPDGYPTAFHPAFIISQLDSDRFLVTDHTNRHSQHHYKTFRGARNKCLRIAGEMPPPIPADIKREVRSDPEGPQYTKALLPECEVMERGEAVHCGTMLECYTYIGNSERNNEYRELLLEATDRMCLPRLLEAV